jgi:hypothetical protein
MATDPAEPLLVTDATPEVLPDLLRLIEELDRRAHARGVAPAADREHYLDDLEGVVRGVIAVAGNEVPRGLNQLLARRPELARLVWSAALEDSNEPRSALLAALSDQGDRRRGLLQTDILLEQSSYEDLVAVVGDLFPEGVAAAWEGTASLYAHRRRGRDAIAADVERQSEQVMERVAAELDLPFRSIESILFGYFRLRSILREAGWGQIADTLGEIVSRADLDLERYGVPEGGTSDSYVVRSLGISVRGRPVRRAIVVPVTPAQGEE